MTVPRDITGQKFGLLTAIRRIPGKGKTISAQWVCLCDCGREVTVQSSRLMTGRQKGCGCLNRRTPESLLDAGVSHFIRQCNAQKRGLSFTLSRDEIKQLIFSPCTYCGCPPSNTIKVMGPGRKKIVAFTYSGLDRVDNDKGYTPGNVLPCCINCNAAKNAKSKEEFIKWVENLILNFPYSGTSGRNSESTQ